MKSGQNDNLCTPNIKKKNGFKREKKRQYACTDDNLKLKRKTRRKKWNDKSVI